MEKVRLGDKIKQIRGVSYKPTDLHNDLNDSSVILLRANNISDGKLNFDDVVYVDKSKVKEEQYLKKGDILVCASSGSKELVGKSAFVEKDFSVTFGAFCKLIRPMGCIAEYLGHYFNSQIYREKISALALGANINNIRNEHIDELFICFPNELVQKSIASLLDKVTDLIDKRKEQLSKLDELVKARFVELFGDQETNPFRWEQCTIGECCTLKSGTSLPSEVENEGGPVPYIKVGDMNYPGNERYITTSSRYVSEATAGKGLFEVGSILFPKRGGAIGTNKKRMTKLPVCADLNVMGVSSKGRLCPEYLLAYFDMIDLGALSDGSSVPQINNKNIAPLVICLPPLELQEQFATFVKQTDKSKLEVQKSLEKLELLKNALMQKYFG